MAAKKQKSAGIGTGLVILALFFGGCMIIGAFTDDDPEQTPAYAPATTATPVNPLADLATRAPATTKPTTTVPAVRRTTTSPRAVAKPRPQPKPKPKPKPQAAYYENCSAARRAGAAPLYVGDPGYRSGLDRDNDGDACE